MDVKKILKTLKLHEQEISVLLGIVIFIFAGVFVVRYVKNLTSSSNAPQKTTNETSQKTNTHKVVKGETLWSIAENYYKKGSDWKKIADANNVSSPSKLEVGQDLVIPDLEAKVQQTQTPEVQTKATPIPQITKEAAATTNEITENSYTVVKGDCLWKIALRAYGDGNQWPKIAEANHLTNPRLIHKGNVFIIPR